MSCLWDESHKEFQYGYLGLCELTFTQVVIKIQSRYLIFIELK